MMMVVKIQMSGMMEARLHCLDPRFASEDLACTRGGGWCLWLSSLLVFMLPLLLHEPASAGPEFSREYKTPCTTCHIHLPELNDLGRAFKDNGFKFPDKDVVLLQPPRALLMATVPRGGAPNGAESQRHELDLRQLNVLRKQVKAHRFPFAFLVIQAAEEKSQRFEILNDKPVLEISGRYFAVYSSSIAQSQRVIETIQHVIRPILKLAVVQFAGNARVQGYAIEVSHQVRGTVLGVTIETPENVGLVLSKKAAEDIVASRTITAQEDLLDQAQVFVNGEARELEIDH